MRTTPARDEIHHFEHDVLEVLPTRPSKLTAKRFQLTENNLAIGVTVMQFVGNDVAQRAKRHLRR